MELAGKVVLLTGAGGGIGTEIAKLFAKEGARILASDMTDSARVVVEEVGGSFIKADLSDPASVNQLAQEALKDQGRVDILVNNAGFQHISSIEEFPEDVWAKMIQVMLTAPFQLIKHLAPAMREAGWGRIINLSSIHGLVASPFKSAYIAAKHGLIGLTKTAALELGSSKITVNAICPAYTRTPIVEKQIQAQALSHGLSEEEVLEKIMFEPMAIKRMVEPEEVAGLALFLASEKAGAITGASHRIDLGWTAR
jgi:3-hydroxybutyrate dehydrogenase